MTVTYAYDIISKITTKKIDKCYIFAIKFNIDN